MKILDTVPYVVSEYSSLMEKVYEIINYYYPPNTQSEELLDLRKLLMTHSVMVAKKSLTIARESGIPGLDMEFIEEAAMLHDIGIFRCNAPSIFCFGDQPYIRHGIIGSELLRSHNLPRHALVCERHTGSGLTKEEIENARLPLPSRDMLPLSMEEKIICYADKFYSKSGDPTQEKDLNKVIGSLAKFGKAPLDRFLELHQLLTGQKI